MAMTSISLLYDGDRGSGFRSAMGARGGTMRTHDCLYVFTVCTIACSLVLCCAHEVDPRPARIAAFLEWCVQGVGRSQLWWDITSLVSIPLACRAQKAGIAMDGLEIRPWGTRVDNGYEVVATKAIPAGQPVFEVPRDAAVRVDSVHTDVAVRLGLDQPTFWDGGSMEPKARVLAQVTVLALYGCVCMCVYCGCCVAVV